MRTTAVRMGANQQFVGAPFRHAVALAGDHLRQDNVVGAIEEVTTVYGHKRALCFVARLHPDKRRVAEGTLGITDARRAFYQRESSQFGAS
jgi:hypothetical protein